MIEGIAHKKNGMVTCSLCGYKGKDNEFVVKRILTFHKVRLCPKCKERLYYE